MLDNGEKMDFMVPSPNSFYHVSLSHTYTHTHKVWNFKICIFISFPFGILNHKVYPIESINIIANKINYTNKSVFLG